ncbi:TonB family protein [bacterium]|nr:TonB family protein [bacterium]
MKHVYQPPQMERSGVSTILTAGALTVAVFLVLPLTQTVSGARESLQVVNMESVTPPPPPPPDEPPPPEDKPEPAKEPEQLQEDTSLPPMSLSQLEMALEGGTGSGIGDFSFGFNTASNMVDQIDVFELSQLDKAPTPTMQIPPNYPAEMQRNKVSGDVVLMLVLDEKGRVREAKVERSSNPAFERPAIDAAKQWMFEPAVKDGKPVRARLRAPIRFGINM